MKLYILSALILFTFSACDNWKPDFKHANTKAQKIMTDEFLWNPIEETSPFGNDDGADAIMEFRKWRKQNQSQDPTVFVEKLLAEWNYSVYNYHQTDTIEIHNFIESKDIGARLYFGIDDVIIATGFGQFIIEGTIDKNLKELILIALKRQLLPFSMKLIDVDHRNKRALQLTRMIEIINAT